MKALFACLLTSCASGAFAATAADQFGAHRWPSEPKLGVDLQPALCGKILGDAVGAFTSVDKDFDIGAALAKDFPPLKATPAIEAAEDGSTPLSRLDLDLDGTGRKQVVIYRANAFGWRGDWHYAYVFPAVADFDAAKSQVASAWNEVPDSANPSPGKPEFSARLFYPSALSNQDEAIGTGNVWTGPALFEANQRFYFADRATPFDGERPAPVQFFRLRANGHVEVVCKIENSTLEEVYKTFTKLPAVESFLSTIRSIGAEGPEQGTYHSGHDAQAKAAEIRASYRPWATSAEDGDYYRFDEQAKAFLEAWSRDEIWNRREYQTLLELTAPAEASYASYLQSAFGVSANEAHLRAVEVIQELIGSQLMVPKEFSADKAQDYFPSTPLHDAVMRRDRAAFDAALAKPQAADLSAALVDAVEWPYGLDRLLTAGADPNSANAFGKTALMVAAHFDRPDAARSLIKAGARANAATPDKSDPSSEGPQVYARTALMYAAENASPATIKVLLDGGADPKAKDSAGSDVSVYLGRNPRFTAAERSSGVVGLAHAAAQFSGPSYACSKAGTATEKAICGSEVLGIFDAQVARAFGELRTKAGPSLVEEQRSWLRSRDQSCAADVDCLAEKLRTRLRYLQERLRE